jgi:hypothetical protein
MIIELLKDFDEILPKTYEDEQNNKSDKLI